MFPKSGTYIARNHKKLRKPPAAKGILSRTVTDLFKFILQPAYTNLEDPYLHHTSSLITTHEVYTLSHILREWSINWSILNIHSYQF
jgi:hypothetical protein